MPYPALPFSTGDPVFIVIAAVLGLIFGSFYNVCIHRYLTGMSIVLPPSHCPLCGHKLSWWENIPLLSYLLLRGRCRACLKPISPRYPLVEALSGIWAAALAAKFGPTAPWLAYMAVGGILIVASFIDLESFILPDVLTLPGAVLAFLCAIFALGLSPVQSLLGAAIGGGSFWLIQALYRKIKGIEGLGTGDIKLMLLLGALLGPMALPVVVLAASVSGLVASVFFLLAAKRRGESTDGFRTAIPFGPFLSLGGMLAVFIQDWFWSMYLGR